MAGHDIDGAGATTADWIKALLLIAVIVAAMVLLFLIGIGAFCGCTTVPAG
jgi:hypothetical protein